MNELTEFYIFALKFLMKKKGIKQKDVAEYLDVAPPSVNLFIKGKRNFSDKKREKIAKYLKTTYLDMLNLGKKLKEGHNQEHKKTKLEIIEPFKDPKIESTGTKTRMIEHIAKTMEHLSEEDIIDVKRRMEERLEKKMMDEKIRKLEQQMERKMAG